VAFLDSDCVPDPGWPGAFADGWAGEVAVQGSVRALEPGLLAGYYERQGILEPMAWSDDGRPYYLITANALVHRDALERIGGFREQFSLAAGEDVDLGLRLAATGKLYSCRSASVAHDFEPDFGSFVRRFLRYGRGNRLLSEFHRSSFFAPRPFWPRSGRPDDLVLAVVAYAALTAGWVRQGPGSS
jgi:GT2 family glycosyltransferase